MCRTCPACAIPQAERKDLRPQDPFNSPTMVSSRITTCPCYLCNRPCAHDVSFHFEDYLSVGVCMHSHRSHVSELISSFASSPTPRLCLNLHVHLPIAVQAGGLFAIERDYFYEIGERVQKHPPSLRSRQHRTRLGRVIRS